jgi:hypothetical protein
MALRQDVTYEGGTVAQRTVQLTDTAAIDRLFALAKDLYDEIAAGGGGGGGGAPTGAEYVTLSTNGSLTHERVLTAGNGIAITDAGAGSTVTVALSDGDKGDISVSGSGATLSIDNNAVTYAKMQDVSAASKLLGRGDSSAGDPQEITIGSGLTMTGTTLSATGGGGGDNITVNGGAVTDADLDDSTPAAPAGDLNVKWQADGSSPANVSAYVDVSALEPLLTINNLTRGPIVALKTADQTAIGTAYADVTDTGLSLESGHTYFFEFRLICDSDATTTGIDVACNGPTASTIIYEQIYWTSATARTERTATAYNNNTASTASNGTARRIFIVRGIVITTAAGTLIARAKRESVGSGPNVRAGSFGRAWRLS